VLFRLCDVVAPEQQQVLAQLTGGVELSGEVVFFSDHGHEKNHFAIVDVQGLESPLIVPVHCLQQVAVEDREKHGYRVGETELG
jgi:hypothetical protein